MGVTVHVNSENRIGLIRQTGRVELPDLLESVQRLLTTLDWLPGYDIVWDCRQVTELVIGHEAASYMVAALRDIQPLIGDGRSAIVVPADIAPLFERMMLLERQPDSLRERRVFQTVGAAMRWLTASDEMPDVEKVALLRQWIQESA